MLEGKDLILATRPYAKEDKRKSWLYTLVAFFIFFAALFGTLYPFHIAIKVFSCLLEAMMLVRLFVIYHDYLHKTILKKSAIANVLFTIFGFYMLTPKSIWKRSHDYHHKHNSKLFTSSIGSFPIVTRDKFLKLSKSQRLNYLFIRHPLTIVFGYIFAFTWGMSILSLFRNPKKHWDSGLALVFHYGLIVFIGINLGWLTALLSVVIPVFIAHGIGSYLFYVQHNFPDATFENKDGWSYIGAAFNSTSFLRMSKVMHWVTANIGYHHIHHVNARIPFYRLPETYNAFVEFQNPKTTSMRLGDVMRCFKLKVWDPNLKRMLTLKEIKN